jgi:hypothetical protein
VNLGLQGKPFEYRHNPKGLLHSTEGTSLAGAEEAMRNYPSHLGYDYKTRDKHQYISLDLAAYSAMDQSDDDPIYQVELVGFAKDMRFLPDWALRNIAEDVVKPLKDAVGIPNIVIPSGFKDGLDGIYPYLASPQSPIRLSYAGLRAFSGWLGHQHLPSPDDHWDPGAINIRRILDLAYAPKEEDDMFSDGDRKTLQELWSVLYSQAHGFGERAIEPNKGEILEQPRHDYEVQHNLRNLLALATPGNYSQDQQGPAPQPGQEFELVKAIKAIGDRLTAIESKLEA